MTKAGRDRRVQYRKTKARNKIYLSWIKVSLNRLYAQIPARMVQLKQESINTLIEVNKGRSARGY